MSKKTVEAARIEKDVRIAIKTWQRLAEKQQELKVLAWVVTKKYRAPNWLDSDWSAWPTEAMAKAQAARHRENHKSDFANHPWWGTYAKEGDHFVVRLKLIRVDDFKRSLGLRG